MQDREPVRKRIVLVGGGHAHVEVLRSFAMKPEPGVGLTLIARELDAPYSGMLPGWVAGHYTFDECHIDLVRLAEVAGVRLIHGTVSGVDRVRRHVLLDGRPPLAFDLLSIDVGITPLLDGLRGAAEHAIAVKPVSAFGPRWTALLERALTAAGPRTIAVVGTGAAGFELVLAVRHRLRRDAKARGIDGDAFRFKLIGSGGLLATHNARARAYARQALAAAGIELMEGDAAVEITASDVRLASGRRIPAEAVLVTTKAAPPTWFRDSGLSLDPDGFVSVRPTLQMEGDDDVLAVGDCAAVLEHPREKAGVFAVRQGPPLARNLRLRTRGEAAEPFTPQRRFLTLLSLGGKSAIAARGAFAVAGDWAWAWKDHIDRKFMNRFNMLGMDRAGSAMTDDEAMRCGGCAAKVGPLTLQRALDRLEALGGAAATGVARGGPVPRDDAAIIDDGGPVLGLETADFFRAFWPEPYVFGEIAAEHAMSDVFAMGGRPQRALAIAVLPYAGPRQSEDDLFQLMAGARAAFDRAGVALAGGHSSEGAELGAGFFVSGSVPRDRILAKAGLRPGDRLILTKPLGTGLLFAGWMRGRARARDIAAALAGMRLSNGTAAAILAAHGAHAATDVTGFGLAGHLMEMLDASRVDAAIDLAAVPRYPGADEMAGAGVRSTLLAENLALAHRIGGGEARDEVLALLLDPQTSGGLLAGLAAASADACLAALHAAGVAAAVVGEVVDAAAGEPVIALR